MLQALINLFFPEICPGCRAPLKTGEFVICIRCRHETPRTSHFLQPQNEAWGKFYGRVPIAHAATFFYFQKGGIARDLIHSLKYKGQEQIGTALGHWLASEFKTHAQHWNPDEIAIVPLHKKRLRERGYNQLSSFATAFSADLELPLSPELLQRNFYAKSQSRKNRWSRGELQQTLFSVRNPEQHRGKHILLIDDVLTTGATLEACARAVLAIPHTKVSVLCIAFSQS